MATITSFVETLRALQEEKKASATPHCSLFELEAYHRGLLPERDLDQIAEHLSLCENCSVLLLYAVVAPDEEGLAFASTSMQVELESAWTRFVSTTANADPDIDLEIDQVYTEISALSREPASPDREAKISSALACLKELQHQEADQFQRQLEGRLKMPIDAGARILERADALRTRLEDLAAKNRAADKASAA